MERIKIGWARLILILTVYLAGHWLLVLPANLYWHPPAGWRFLFLLFAPMRLWPWLLLGEWAIYLPDSLKMLTGHSGLMAFLTLARMAALALGPWLLLRVSSPLLEGSARSMLRFLGAMLISALGNALFNAWRPFEETAVLSTLQIFLQLVLGDINGMLLMVPPGLMLVFHRPIGATVQRWTLDASCILLPSMLLYGVVILNSPQHVYFFATALCAVPVLYFGLRSGWRGVAVSFPVASIAVAMVGIASGNTALATQVQLFLVIVGVASLLLGASVDELNARNHALAASNARLDRASDDLREAARRNLGLSEDLRRWITSELHDELGQNLTALQTRLKLAERKIGASDHFAPAWDIIANMRHSVSGLMASLRPAGLDEFGLASALEGGSIRALVETSGMTYHVRVDDPTGLLDRLDNNTQTAIYRIVQESATNAVRHANAGNVHVRLRARKITNNLFIALTISDDGQGIVAHARHEEKRGIGLQGIRDSVLVLGGRLRIRSDADGTRLQVAFAFRDLLPHSSG